MKVKYLLFIIVLLAPITFLVIMKTRSNPLQPGVTIDKLLVEKSKRKMHAVSPGKVLKTYAIALGSSPEGRKECEGDMKTPEGIYTIDSKNPNSAYHLYMGISYPNSADRQHATALGKSPGSDIKIHGLKNGSVNIGKAHLLSDWTHGCIAVTNEEIEELYLLVAIGTVIEIKP